MANFDDVHKRDLHAADGRLRLGEIWRIALREPIGPIKHGYEAAYDSPITVVQFVAVKGGKLEPATDSDRFQIAEWKRRHRDTPPDRFGPVPGLLQQS